MPLFRQFGARRSRSPSKSTVPSRSSTRSSSSSGGGGGTFRAASSYRQYQSPSRPGLEALSSDGGSPRSGDEAADELSFDDGDDGVGDAAAAGAPRSDAPVMAKRTVKERGDGGAKKQTAKQTNRTDTDDNHTDEVAADYAADEQTREGKSRSKSPWDKVRDGARAATRSTSPWSGGGGGGRHHHKSRLTSRGDESSRSKSPWKKSKDEVTNGEDNDVENERGEAASAPGKGRSKSPAGSNGGKHHHHWWSPHPRGGRTKSPHKENQQNQQKPGRHFPCPTTKGKEGQRPPNRNGDEDGLLHILLGEHFGTMKELDDTTPPASILRHPFYTAAAKNKEPSGDTFTPDGHGRPNSKGATSHGLSSLQRRLFADKRDNDDSQTTTGKTEDGSFPIKQSSLAAAAAAASASASTDDKDKSDVARNEAGGRKGTHPVYRAAVDPDPALVTPDKTSSSSSLQAHLARYRAAPARKTRFADDAEQLDATTTFTATTVVSNSTQVDGGDGNGNGGTRFESPTPAQKPSSLQKAAVQSGNNVPTCITPIKTLSLQKAAVTTSPAMASSLQHTASSLQKATATPSPADTSYLQFAPSLQASNSSSPKKGSLTKTSSLQKASTAPKTSSLQKATATPTPAKTSTLQNAAKTIPAKTSSLQKAASSLQRAAAFPTKTVTSSLQKASKDTAPPPSSETKPTSSLWRRTVIPSRSLVADNNSSPPAHGLDPGSTIVPSLDMAKSVDTSLCYDQNSDSIVELAMEESHGANTDADKESGRHAVSPPRSPRLPRSLSPVDRRGTSPSSRDDKAPSTTGPHNDHLARVDKHLEQDHPDACKIYLLLLDSVEKIFELCPITYDSKVATIGDVLNLIQFYATEPALGKQDYVGLIRPRDGEELLGLDMAASQNTDSTYAHGVNEPDCEQSACILRGEVLVAIPQGCPASDCGKLAVPILQNPKLQKLLKRSDPLAPRKRKKGKGKRNRGRGRERDWQEDTDGETDTEAPERLMVPSSPVSHGDATVLVANHSISPQRRPWTSIERASSPYKQDSVSPTIETSSTTTFSSPPTVASSIRSGSVEDFRKAAVDAASLAATQALEKRIDELERRLLSRRFRSQSPPPRASLTRLPDDNTGPRSPARTDLEAQVRRNIEERASARAEIEEKVRREMEEKRTRETEDAIELREETGFDRIESLAKMATKREAERRGGGAMAASTPTGGPAISLTPNSIATGGQGMSELTARLADQAKTYQNASDRTLRDICFATIGAVVFRLAIFMVHQCAKLIKLDTPQVVESSRRAAVFMSRRAAVATATPNPPSSIADPMGFFGFFILASFLVVLVRFQRNMQSGNNNVGSGTLSTRSYHRNSAQEGRMRGRRLIRSSSSCGLSYSSVAQGYDERGVGRLTKGARK